jgi:restriction system protein
MAKRKSTTSLPQYDELFITVVKALMQLGGSGTIEEINGKVYEIEKLSEEALQIMHGDDASRIEIDYRLAWSRTYLKKYGLLENSKRGIWSLTSTNINLKELDRKQIIAHFKDKKRQENGVETIETVSDISVIEEIEEINATEEMWRDKLLGILYSIPPSAFERLTQRLLRESGFTQVEVTGKVGDGGIDGKGIVKINGFLSFHIIFQCKRYKGKISPSQIRDFRGAMQGRADKGLFITTGSFTREAVKEATRDGAPPIDLIDGELLCDKLKEMQLGVLTKQIEVVEVNKDWFNNL